ncbi:protein kinase [bacterium]|nr:protein kinase [bacterium]
MSSKWIWPFELLEKLGEGGMGVVYRARYVGNNRIVAVKLLPEEVAKHPTLAARFDRELDILKQLKHPNIVHCFGGTTESKQRYYAMEYVEGGTLSEALRKKGQLSWDYVVEYGIQIASALEYAHERGIIHRDLKPANFLLTKAGKLKLSDFGLAAIVAGQRLTTAGKTAGTFLYMAPEQIRGKPELSNRTDLYALGCVLFELLTGQPPFDADAPAEILHKHLKEPPRHVSTLVLDCPAELDRLVDDLLKKNPDDRPESAAVVQQRLEAILRPSLSQVDPYARTPANPVTHVVSTTADPDDELIGPQTSTAHPVVTKLLLVVVVVVAMLAGWGWRSAWAAAARAKLLQQAWEQQALAPGAGQVPALQQLARMPELSSSVADQLLTLIETDGDVEARVAALDVLQAHPEIGKAYVSQLNSIEKSTEEPTVRQHVDSVRLKLVDALDHPQGSDWGWIWTLVFIAAFGGGAYYGTQQLIKKFESVR